MVLQGDIAEPAKEKLHLGIIMNLSKLRDLLIQHEGLKNKVYQDTEGFLTIGVGHNLSAKGLTNSQIMSILTDDITDTINFLNIKFPWFHTLDDVRARAVADLTFDLMGGVLEFHRMLDALEAGDWNTAASELLNSKFAQQTGNRARDLAQMIRTGKDI
jgi:lysozyme